VPILRNQRDHAAALARGVDQIVIVGIGYDGRPLRFRTPGVCWIEVDHPATQPDKCRRLASLGVPLDHLAFVAVDLIEDDLATALAAAGHRGDRASLFICEGLFSYLPLSVSVAVCQALRIRATPDSVRGELPGVVDSSRSKPCLSTGRRRVPLGHRRDPCHEVPKR
jgi:methyltransferase (TIGR00027 family)